jgi:hypothetical protein
MTNDRRVELQTALDRAEVLWQRHTQVLDRLPETQELHGFGSGWLARDDYAHNARWCISSLAELRAHLDGEPRPDWVHEPEDEVNVRWQEEDRALTREQARERAVEAREALLGTLRDLPDDRLDDVVLAIAKDDPGDHLETHFRWMVQGVMRDEERWWNAIEAALDAHPGGRFHLEGDPWDARDVWAHLARWLHRSVDVCEARLEGRTPERITDFDAVNAQWQQADSALSLDEAKGRAMEARRRLLEFVDATPTERWDAPMSGSIASNSAYHYLEHLRFGGIDPTE